MPSLSSYQGLKHFSQSPVLAWQELQSAKQMDLFWTPPFSILRGEVSIINYLERISAAWEREKKHVAMKKMATSLELREIIRLFKQLSITELLPTCFIRSNSQYQANHRDNMSAAAGVK